MLIEITYNVTDVYMSTTETPVYVEISFEQPGSASAVWGSITGTLSNQTDLQNALNAKFDDPTGTSTQYIDGTGALQTFPLTLPVLQEVRNQTGATLDAGTVVYINGATGNKPTVTKAIATGDATSAQTLGMISAAIANNGVGYVVVIGTCGGLDTSAYTEGQQLYLSGTVAGGVTTTKPYAPIHLVYVGIVTRSHPNLGTIEVRVQNGYEMDEIHNVSAQTPSNNDGLFYNTSTSLWESKSITTALGYTPVPTTRNITINGVTYDLSADRTYTISTGISGSGAAGQVTYWTGASAVNGSNNLFWDNANSRLGIGTNAPADTLHLSSGGIRIQNIRASLDNFYTGGVVNGLKIQNTTTNGRTLLGLVPNGTSKLADFWVFNTSDTTTNYSALAWGFEETSNFWGINTISAGTGVTRPIYINATNAQNVGTANISFYTNGNVGIGTGSTAPAVRFGVTGDTLLRGSGATSATTALTVQNSSSTNLFTVRNDGRVGIGTTTPIDKLVVMDGNFYIQTSTTNFTGKLYQVFKAATDLGQAMGFYGEFSSGNVVGYGFSNNAGADIFQIRNNANVIIQNGGTFTDGGQRLQVMGDTLLRGSGATSATTALTVQNSSSTNLFTVRNDNRVTIRDNYIEPYQSGSGLTDAIKIVGSNNGATIGIQNTNAVGFSGIEYLNNSGAVRVFTGFNNNNGTEFRFNNVATNGYTTFLIGSTQAMTIKTNRQIRFHPLSSAPASPEAGDVYYDSTLNKLRVYTTAWETITSI